MSEPPFPPGELPKNKEFRTYTFQVYADCKHKFSTTRSATDIYEDGARSNAIMGGMLEHGFAANDDGTPIEGVEPCMEAQDATKWTATLISPKPQTN